MDKKREGEPASRSPVAKTHEFIFKVVIVGESGVGKTSLMLRYADNTFNPSGTYTTIGVDFKTRTQCVNVQGRDRTVKLDLWDTAGQERFVNIVDSYVRDAQGVVVVFSFDDFSSLSAAETWIQKVYAREKNASVILVGNKADLPNEARQITDMYLDSWLREHAHMDVQMIRVSAATGDNVDDLFEHLGVTLVGSADRAGPIENDKGVFKLRAPAPLEPDQVHVTKRGKCC